MKKLLVFWLRQIGVFVVSAILASLILIAILLSFRACEAVAEEGPYSAERWSAQWQEYLPDHDRALKARVIQRADKIIDCYVLLDPEIAWRSVNYVLCGGGARTNYVERYVPHAVKPYELLAQEGMADASGEVVVDEELEPKSIGDRFGEEVGPDGDGENWWQRNDKTIGLLAIGGLGGWYGREEYDDDRNRGRRTPAPDPSSPSEISIEEDGDGDLDVTISL